MSRTWLPDGDDLPDSLAELRTRHLAACDEVASAILPAMPEESTPPDLVDLSRKTAEAANRGDLDAMMSVFTPDAVYEGAAFDVKYEGVAAIRRAQEEWMGAYEELRSEWEQIVDLGNGVLFGVALQQGRPVGGSGYVQQREAFVSLWVEGRVAWMRTSLDIDEARAAAERLAEERA